MFRGSQIIVVITVAVHKRAERAKQGALLRLAIIGVTSQRAASERHRVVNEAVWADKVIWLGGLLSSVPTVGCLGLVGILPARPHTSPRRDNGATAFSAPTRRRASCTVTYSSLTWS